jgi:hypothetical protein
VAEGCSDDVFKQLSISLAYVVSQLVSTGFLFRALGVQSRQPIPLLPAAVVLAGYVRDEFYQACPGGRQEG